MAAVGIETIASEVLAALDSKRQVEPFTARFDHFGSDDAYRVATVLRNMRIARGEKPAGRKIGFTNRNIWAEYAVDRPLWGYVYATTLHDIHPGSSIKASHLPEPRIEPEIVLGLGRDIGPETTLPELAKSVEWVAHGFEVVQSIYPGWRFAVADCIADGGLHGALFVGPKLQVNDHAGLASALSGLTVALSRNGEIVDNGRGANVLDGPIQALGHLVGVLATDSFNPSLRKGEVITTGTLTRAFPISPGERWSTTLTGFDLPGLSVDIV
ncbi:2-oxo-3-hexenedioate decarboxylase [Mesorhizobium albiziae]|uniref:2-oxo-3-hexenedioate decarboxylase n=1 Tax=Neomesorhizobium albiziae TaxID=335020 RepID=A0A1I3XMX0_9HYPH|nr:fumarylacetoacetate hydrolase family protein [Mesorhizobium albiziae]GLS30304.1 2-keto-4-pentenoate hydratase [Mesorhizobium albiziae]SFK20904.1 2-oxo-3-hexenedioate decarboxylase [Mesorhizobium albiziae]